METELVECEEGNPYSRWWVETAAVSSTLLRFSWRGTYTNASQEERTALACTLCP